MSTTSNEVSNPTVHDTPIASIMSPMSTALQPSWLALKRCQGRFHRKASLLIRLPLLLLIGIAIGITLPSLVTAFDPTDSVVRFDNRSLIINGERKLLLSGGVHYARVLPAQWPRVFSLAKEMGEGCLSACCRPSPSPLHFPLSFVATNPFFFVWSCFRLSLLTAT